MSTKTANYQLHQWEPTDQFLREDFNADFAKIDAGIKNAFDRAGEVESSLSGQLTSAKNVLNTAIGKKADQTALTALQNTVNTKADAGALAALQNTVNSKADTAALNALQGVVAGKCEVVAGSYAGNDTLPRSFNLGFQPKAVFLFVNNGTTYDVGNCYGGLFTPGLPLLYQKYTCAEVTATGFQLTAGSVNKSNFTYYYLCLK